MIRNFLSKSHAFFSKQSEVTIVSVALIVSTLFGYLDFVTGFEISFSFFYLFPIAFTSWFASTPSAYAITGYSVAIWLFSNWLAGETFSVEIIRYWNAGIRLAAFAVIVRLIQELKLTVEHERWLSRTDYLTGISNSREFNRLADIELARARRYKLPFSGAYIDLDNFKAINDQLGHSIGDEILQQIVKIVAPVIRKTDLFARLGGDEFIVLFPGSGKLEAMKAVEKVQAILNKGLQDQPLPVTFSIGVVTYLSPPKSVDDLLSKTDQIMYEAKQQGKNAVLYVLVD